MEFLKKFDWSAKSIAKVIGIVLLGILAITIAAALISFSIRTIFNTAGEYKAYPQAAYDDYGYDYAMEEAAYGATSLAVGRAGGIIVPPTPEPDFSTGTDAEDYEVKYYTGTIKTRKLDDTCETIAALKIKDYVIFENSNKNDENCYYSFKVEKKYTEEIVELIESFKPETFNANIRTIKKAVEGIQNELEILNNKLTSVEATLSTAQEQYDEISKLATRNQDAETLAKIIDSKLNLIEKLTNERLNIKAQIDRYNKSMEDQLDQLNYTFFSINVFKDVIFDWKDIKETWKFEAKEMVRNINEVFQAISLNLVTYIVRFAQAVLYLFISIFLLKFVWIGVKKIWKSEFKRKKR